ncbi:hypothetical protein ACCO45_006448 [Purpureocillium lilacinum]|uniref:Uncharacterized protein n=1 Tax=Purpureocillium lilacinum TaxID=33203 RepID=A0ACC4DS52_PURLI
MSGRAFPSQPPSFALLSLVPVSKPAEEVAAHVGNRHLIWKRQRGDFAIAIGHVRSTVNSSTLASIGRNADIIVHSGSISQIQYCRQHRYSGRAARPSPGESRSTVIECGEDLQLGFGGIEGNLYLFDIEWHANQAQIKARLAKPVPLRDNPRLALTAEEIDMGPTQLQTPSHGMKTRIHVPAARRPNYKTFESLGSGTFGQVFRALDIDLNISVAVKVFRAPQMDGQMYDDFYTILKREVETLYRVKHDNIIPIIGTENLSTSQPRLFMPLMDGSLESLATREYQARYEHCELMVPHMLQALDYLDVHGVIHRDIKPANILYKREATGYRFVLGDFGLCNNVNLAATAGKGTPIYMAPEILRGKTYLQSTRSDIWSLLVTILWTIDLADIRKLEVNVRRRPARRPSAAELLCKQFGGRGLTTPSRRIQVPGVQVTPPEQAPRQRVSGMQATQVTTSKEAPRISNMMDLDYDMTSQVSASSKGKGPARSSQDRTPRSQRNGTCSRQDSAPDMRPGPCDDGKRHHSNRSNENNDTLDAYGVGNDEDEEFEEELGHKVVELYELLSVDGWEQLHAQLGVAPRAPKPLRRWKPCMSVMSTVLRFDATSALATNFPVHVVDSTRALCRYTSVTRHEEQRMRIEERNMPL